MLITEPAVSPFVRGLPDSPGVSVVYGTRSRFDGPQEQVARAAIAWRQGWAHLLGQRGPAADHRPAYGFCGQHDWRVAAGKTGRGSGPPSGTIARLVARDGDNDYA